jgi:signal transduction histidine kinase
MSKRPEEKRRDFVKKLVFRKARPVIDSLSDMLNIPIALFDADGAPVYPSPWCNRCCERIGAGGENNPACIEHYVKVVNYVKIYQEPYVEKCHAEFDTVAYPLILDDITQVGYSKELLGVLCFSPLYLVEPDSIPEHEQSVAVLQGVRKMSKRQLDQLLTLTGAMFGNIVEFSRDITEVVENSVDIQNELTLLYDFARKAGGKVNQADILADIWEILKQNIEPARLCIFLYDEYTGELDPINGLSGEDEHFEVGPISIISGEGFLAEAIESGKSVIRNGLYGDPIFHHVPELTAERGMACPIKLDERLLGLIVLFDKKNGENFFADDAKFTDTLAGSIGVVFEIISLTARLAKAAESWKEVSFRAAHKIGNALFALKGPIAQIELLRSMGKLTDDKVTELVQRLNERMKQADSIINEFKGYIHPDKLNRELQHINSLLEPIIQDVKETVRDQIIFRLQFAENLPMLRLDSGRIRIDMEELIQNATHFIEGPGEIVVRTDIASNLEKRRLELPVNEDFVAIEVRDTGAGVRDEDKDRIFYPFFSTRGTGTGQGLAIVATDIRQHGGEIKEIGTYGKGARFLILLPVDGNC